MKKTISILVLGMMLLLAGCRAASPETTIRLPVGFIPNVQFAPLYVAIEKGFYSNQGLDVQLDYSSEIDSVALVGANQIPFAIVSGEQVLLARGQGLPVVYVLAWTQKFPVAIASLKEENILKPADLKGKRIGIPILSGASYIGLETILNVGGLTDEDVTLDTIGFTQVAALSTKMDDAVVIYGVNEPLQLTALGYEVNLIRVSDYLEWVGNGLITNETTLANKPELIQKMVAATVQGIQFSLEYPDETFQICLKYVDNLKVGDQIQQDILNASMELWKADQIGYSNPQAWQNMQDILMRMGLLQSEVDLSKAYSNAYLQK